ncbi:tRNA (guanosine(46)-N7)-methyltransferase TrmB [bacterium]|nr:tRNA (guanosine(46)-N7)-methyltransferase TrmB [bacterium]
MKPEYKRKPIRSYVLRGGRMTDGQQHGFEQAWAVYGLSLFDGPLDPVKAFGRNAPRVVEVGFGMGDSLLAMAQAEPDVDFIGIEVHPPGVGRLINNAHKLAVRNLRVYMADAIDVLEDCIADNDLARFQLYFPDPWHKKKHNKRRIVQAKFVRQIHNKLTHAGVCHFATDWEEYAQQMLEVLSESDLTNQAGEHQYSAKPTWRPDTKFERRGEKLGHGVWDLLFEKSND